MKKLNLMPSEYKAEEIFKMARKGAVLILLLPILYIGYLGVNNFLVEKQITEVKEKVNHVESLERSVDNINYTIEQRTTFLQSLERSAFELNKFVEFLNYQVPNDLNIISVDSTDRLTVEEDRVPVVEISATEDETTEEEIDDRVPTPPPVREKMTIILRGYSSNATSIADLMYKVTLLDFVDDVKLSAIEEKYTTDGYSNVFEIMIQIN